MNYKSFDDIRPTAAMLADDVGRRKKTNGFWAWHYIAADTEYASGEYLTAADARRYRGMPRW